MELILKNGTLSSNNPDLQPDFLVSDYEAKAIGIWKSICSDQQTFTFYSSGSTGVPKPIVLKRSQLVASAKNTINYFGLKKGQLFLCCLNVDFIAGFMVIFRAVLADSDCIVVEPNANPLAEIDSPIDFISVVPLQLPSVLAGEQKPKILLGGASPSDQIIKQIQESGKQVWAGYGMTETASHIALTLLNGQPLRYQLFDNVLVQLDDRGCLMINAPMTDNQWITTNDLVELNGRSLTFYGRYDRVFNTGGIKVSADWAEGVIRSVLERLIPNHRYVVTAVPDQRLGQALVLLIEAESLNNGEEILTKLQALDKYKMPKHILTITNLPETLTGKIDLAQCQRYAEEQLGQ